MVERSRSLMVVRALHRAPIPIRTGSANTQAMPPSVGSSEIVNRRTTPGVRSGRTILERLEAKSLPGQSQFGQRTLPYASQPMEVPDSNEERAALPLSAGPDLVGSLHR